MLEHLQADSKLLRNRKYIIAISLLFFTRDILVEHSPSNKQKLPGNTFSSSTSALFHACSSTDHNQQRLHLENEPTKSFVCRYLHDYVPKSERKKGKASNGGKPKQQRSTNFGDRINGTKTGGKKFLNLLVCTLSREYHFLYLSIQIPKCLVFGVDKPDIRRVKIEACIVTKTIEGCIYIHPYFTFYTPSNDGKYSLSNPIFICLGYDKGYEKLNDMLDYLSTKYE